jgi:hypothetical protein
VSVIDPYSIRAIHGKIENTVKMKQWSEACKTIVVAQDLTQFPSKSSNELAGFKENKATKACVF